MATKGMTLDRLRKLDREATPGPWKAWPNNHELLSDEYRRHAVVGHLETAVERHAHGLFVQTNMHPETANANAALIAETRNALPALLAIVEAAQRMVDADNPYLGHQGAELQAALTTLEELS